MGRAALIAAASVLLLLFAVTAVEHTDGSNADAYVEIIPDRHTFRGAQTVYGWGELPARCCVAQVKSVGRGGMALLLMDGGELLLAKRLGAGRREIARVHVSGNELPLGTRLVANTSSSSTAQSSVAATPTGLSKLQCSFVGGDARCTVGEYGNAAFGSVKGAHVIGDATFVGATNGLFRCRAATCVRLLEAAITAVAVHHDTNMVAAGSHDKLYLLDSDGTVQRWEWCTAIDGPDAGSGGVLDGPVTALAFVDNGDLYAGNDIALNIWSATSGAWSRVSGDMGLPVGNITDLVVDMRDPVTKAGQRWIGTSRGIAIWSTDPDADPTWQYLYGPRWHPGRRVSAMESMTDGSVCVATDGGVVWLEQQAFTLAKKAEAMQAKLARHERHGLVAGCALRSFGNTSHPQCIDDDNNGLWTAFVAAAELLRYSVTNDPAAADSARRLFAGLDLLHNITGVPGLYARSVCAPDEVGCAAQRNTLRRSCKSQVAPGCCPHNACGLQWRNSTAPGLEGWVWKSDTSSDETCGHFFAFTMAAQLAPTTVSTISCIF